MKSTHVNYSFFALVGKYSRTTALVPIFLEIFFRADDIRNWLNLHVYKVAISRERDNLSRI